MSQENVEIVRPIYAAMNRGDLDAAFGNAHPDFALTAQRGPGAGTYKGREAVQAFLQDRFAEPFDLWIQEPEEFFESRDHVVVFVKVRTRPKGSSSEIEARNGHLWTIRDGQVLSVKTFAVREEALEAAGLSE